MLSRRTFVSWLSGLGAALGFGVRARSVNAGTVEAVVDAQAATLDATMVTRLGEAVLPGELGDAGIGRVSRAFTQWVAGYRQGVELVHPYGSATLRRTGESPVRRWRTQLAALDREARQKHRSGFGALSRDLRRALVRAAIEGERTNRMPDALDANHVALALVAWYFASPDATDLCYQSKIERNQCRPLVNNGRHPLPLVDARRTTGTS
jgi:hypothetical protein